MASPDAINSRLVARNLYVHDRRTSVKLEIEFWTIFQEIAAEEGVSVHDLTSGIAESKQPFASLTGAIRVFIVLYLREKATFSNRPLRVAEAVKSK
jgi:predicted DNA-binding ribbon-helix-helix protein